MAIGLMSDNVMLSASSVVNCLAKYWLRSPRMARCYVFVVVRLGGHVIKHFLERSVLGWGIEAQIVSRVSGERLV